MKSLTISQPYASLIASGEKWVENRTWPTEYKGPIAIHAGKGTQYMTAAEMRAKGTLTGCIVAVAELIGCVEIVQTASSRLFAVNARNDAELRQIFLHDIRGVEILQHPHTEGPWCWVLRHVRPLSTPIPATGAQGLWSLPRDLEERVMSAVTTDAQTEAEDIPADELETVDGEQVEFGEEIAAARLSDLEREVRAAETEAIYQKKVAKSAKDDFDELDARLRALIARGPDRQRKLPLECDEDEPSKPDDSWKQTPILDVLDVSDKKAEILESAGVTTVGKFEELRAGEGLTSLKGIGQSTAEEWEAAVLDWIAENNITDDNELPDELPDWYVTAKEADPESLAILQRDGKCFLIEGDAVTAAGVLHIPLPSDTGVLTFHADALDAAIDSLVKAGHQVNVTSEQAA